MRGTAGPAAATARKNACELRRVLAPRLGLGAARAVDRERRRRRDRLGHVVRRQAAGEHQRHVDPVELGQAPVEASRPCRPGCRARGRRAGGSRCGTLRGRAPTTASLHPHGLHHLGSRCGGRPRGSTPAPRRRGAGASAEARSGRPPRPPRRAWRSRTRPPPRRGGAARRRSPRPPRRAHARGLCGQKISPIAQAPSVGGRRASSRFVMPQTLTRVIPGQW